jgi:hypothetical protein
MLQHGFIFRVVTPLYFAHLDYLTASHTLCGIQDPDWTFVVGQITSKVKIFHR